MRIEAFIITGLLLLLWDGAFGLLVYFSLRDKGRGRWAGVIGGLLVMWGVTSFALTSLCADCGTSIVPARFQWPPGWASGIMTTPAGMHVVPIQDAGRVQVYDADWRFVRGWQVDARGGVFKLAPAAGEQFDIVACRPDKRWTYDLDGRLVGTASIGVGEYEAIPEPSGSRFFPMWPWAWPLASPLIAFLTMVIGIAVLIVGGKANVRFGRRQIWPRQTKTAASA